MTIEFSSVRRKMPNCMMSHFCDRSYSIDQKKLLWASVRPKPGFGIGSRNQGPILVLEPKNSFSESEILFLQTNQNFSSFLHLWGYKFYKLEDKRTNIFKNNLNIFKI